MESLSGFHRVVCVDDEPAILSALRRALRGEPYRLSTTDSPALALEWLEAGDVSLLISDQRMPSISGLELLDEARGRSPRTAGMILTAYPGDTLRSPGVGGPVVVGKPWDDARLKQAIRRLLKDVELHVRST